MPPFRPLFRSTNIQMINKMKKLVYFLYDDHLETRKENSPFKSTLRMTLTEISPFERPEKSLQLPDLPEETLYLLLIDNEEEEIEEIIESYPLAISDVTQENILSAQKLTAGEDVKEIYSLELSTNYSNYQPGDTISILTKNRERDVKRLFNHLGITELSERKCKVCEKHTQLKKGAIRPSFVDKVTTLSYLFTHCVDVQCLPKKLLIRVLAEFTKDLHEKRHLEELCSKEKSDLYVKEILETNQTFLDLLLKFPSCCPPVARLLENLPKLLPRPYSIASSPLSSPNKVRIVFSVINNEDGIVREGLCTGMLKYLINKNESKVKMFFRKCNGFNLPETDVPLILIGPGTGIAPFIGFLEHRKVQGTKGKILMFYGCRYKNRDYLFKNQLQEYLDCGVLTRLHVAFSRDENGEAKYVQDNLKKFGEEISQLIFEENALVYVCGDAKNMRKDIQNSFVEIFENHRGMTNKEAMDCMKKLQKEKRYLQDIWA